MGSKNSWLLITLFVILLPVSFYFYFLAGEVLKQLSVWALVGSCLWLAATLAMGLTAAWSDPGILPRNLNPRNTLRIIGATDYGVEGTISRLVFHEQNPDFLFGKEVLVNGQRIFLKYCGTCEIFRPPRCSHCSFCDNCIEDFDHHCPWLSNCIGKRNYRFFMLFVVMITLLTDAVAVQMYILYYRLGATSKLTIWSSLLEFWPVTTLGLVTTLIGLVLTILTGYHLLLISNDLTTSEQIKMTRAKEDEIVDSKEKKTCCGNVYRIMCGLRFPRMVPWKLYASTAIAKPSEDV